MKTNVVGAWIYAAIIIMIAIVVSVGITSCDDLRETVENRAQRDHTRCMAYCQAADSILVEMRGQYGHNPVCVCVPLDHSCDGEGSSCEMEWD